jgi:hypothetical protein
MGGNKTANVAGVFDGSYQYPSALRESGYWQINDTFLYMFGGLNYDAYGIHLCLLDFGLIYLLIRNKFSVEV